MDTKIVANKKAALFNSWLIGLALVMGGIFLIGLTHYSGDLGRLLVRSNLQPALLCALIYSVIWAAGGYVGVAEGTFDMAEYGGNGNGIQKIHFRDGRSWPLTQPVFTPLEFAPPPQCIVILLVEENFLGWTRFRFRYFSLRYGRDVPPDGGDGRAEEEHYRR